MAHLDKQFVKINFLLSIMVLLTSCTSYLTPNPGHPTIESIDSSLQEAYETDQSLENKGIYSSTSEDIKSALLPPLTLEEHAQKTNSSGKRFNVSVKNVSVNSFLLGLVKDSKENVIINPGVSGNITLDLKNVTLEDVLNVLSDSYGYQFRQTTYGYEVLPPGLETRIFTVNYLNIDRSGQSNTLVSSGQITQKVVGGGSESGGGMGGGGGRYREAAPSASIQTSSKSDFWGSLKNTLNEIIGAQSSGGKQVIVDPQAGTVFVRAYANDLQRVGEYLDTLQSSMTRQVILEAKILEVDLDDEYQAGIDWSLFGMNGFHQYSDRALGDNLPEVTADNPLYMGTLTATAGSFNMTIKLLSTQGNVQVLSSPRIATLNNQKAVIKVGQDRFFITDISNSTATSSAENVSTQNVDFTPFFSGISLDVTPEIDANSSVILHIHPVVSQVTEDLKQYKLNNAEQEVTMAKSDIRESDNVVKAQNGQIVVIGGLIENRTVEYNASTPGVDKIPIVGAAFRRTSQKNVKSELIILIRPIVVQNNTWTRQAKDAAKRFHKLKQGYHFGPMAKKIGNLGEWKS